jgi:membrane peptidoglycan carboxypeptidase
VHEARPRHSTRSTGPGLRRGGLPVQRSRRDAHPSGVGWWQPPKPPKSQAQKGRGGEISARHRVPDPTEVLPLVLAPARATRPDPERLAALQRRARRLRLLRRGLLGVAAAAVLGPLLAFAVGYLAFSVPNPDQAVNNQVALVSFADGSQLTRLVPEEGNRIKVPIHEVPMHVRHAVLAAEDRTFYSNPGFDFTGIVRAAWNQLRGGEGGGSTITQQFVKKALVGDEQTLWRKYKEVILAVKISQERSKDEILADYLNTIYFGRGAYGIQSAAHAYFGKPVQDLTPSDGALLAGLIQSPSRWDPAVRPERTVERWNFVLDGMVAQGWLSPAERAAAQFPPTGVRRSLPGGVPTDSRGHIVSAVLAELEELGFTEEDIGQEGLRITTTVDPRRQQHVVDAAHGALDRQPVNLRSAAVAIDPKTGGVLAYYGGDNGLGLDYAQVRKLAGSTFKPFVVLAGLMQETPVGLGEVFDGREMPGLRNADGADCDECDLKQAMTVSNNAVFHTLTEQIGPEAVAAAARAAGITAPLDDPTEGIALGNKEVSTLELASAYATIAAGGVWRQPHLVASVVTADNRVLYQASTEGERRFPERVARNVVEALLGVAEHDGLALPDGRPVAAKTGTVQSKFDGQNNDAWMSGFTPSLTTAVWMGTDMNSPIRTARGTPIQGSSLPGDVWQNFMSGALAGAPVEDFPPFRPIGEPPASYRPDEEQPPSPSVPPSMPPPAPAPLPPAVGPEATPPPDDPDPPPDAPDEPDDPAVMGDAEADDPEDEGCSVTPCG